MRFVNTGVTRVEVINHCEGHEGREYMFIDRRMRVELDFQDDGKTLKVFISNPEKSAEQDIARLSKMNEEMTKRNGALSSTLKAFEEMLK